MLELIQVEKSFEQEEIKRALFDALDLKVSPKDFYAVLGPSGVGKSTLLSIMCGLDKPSKGHVLFKGLDMARAETKDLVKLRSEQFGFVFQAPYHLNYRTVIENIMMPSLYSQRYTRKEALERARFLASYVGIEALSDRMPGTLSGGELQRMVFARALLLEPNIVFADEPTGSLDQDNSIKILELLQAQAKEGRAVVMVTHDADAAEYATQVLNLSKSTDAKRPG